MTRHERILYLCRQAPRADFDSIACTQLLASLEERYMELLNFFVKLLLMTITHLMTWSCEYTDL